MIVITGGAGFIGSNLVHSLNADGFTKLLVVDRLITAHTNKCANLVGAVYQLIGPEALFEWLDNNQVDAVVHLGAITDTRRHDGEMFAVNYCLSINLFNWCAKHKVPFLYASSAATYGHGEYGFDDKHEMMNWLVPQNTYGWSKHVFDRWVLEHGRVKGDHPPMCVGLKFFNVYGPREWHKGAMASVISQKMDEVRDGLPIILFKSHRQGILDGEQKRDFIHVDDVCAIIKFFLWNRSEFGIFNVGTGYARSFRDVAVALGEACGKPVEIVYMNMPNDIRSTYQYHTEAVISKLRKAGYIAPFISLDEGVRRTVQAYEALKKAA